ncbi:MAG: response regulator, partial [Nitrospirae bacterium]|nr:response regulator [Nitrospirota bacterium]
MKKIHVVDDDDAVREVLSAALIHFGHEAYKASNGAEAIDVLKANPEIEIVILDLRMPVMSGQEVCPLIKNMRPDVEIIISSGFIDEPVLRELNNHGVKYILHKPYPLPVLDEIINNHSSRQG